MPWLLAILAVLLALRWWDWREHDTPTPLAEAVVRQPPPGIADLVVATAKSVSRANLSQRELDDTEPRNAFAVRVPPVPPVPPPLPAPPQIKPFVGPPLPPSPPLVTALVSPFQVIGTWDDAAGSSVFLAGPRNTLQARAGDLLLSEYQVVQITKQQVLLRHVASKQEVRLSIPTASTTTVVGRP